MDDTFSYLQTKDGHVHIRRWGRTVKTLAGKDAARFLNRAASSDEAAAQLLMAKATGQFKFGNERASKQTGKRRNTGRDPSLKDLREADRIANLPPEQQKDHPSAVAADAAKLNHINTYGSLPEYYIDLPFVCRRCGKREIWRAQDQKWYYEEAKGHIDATAVECHDCRVKHRGKQSSKD